MGESVKGLQVFVVLMCVWVYFCCCSGRCLCQGLQGLGLCKVGVISLLPGDECVGGRGSLVTDCERMGGEGESWGTDWATRGRTRFWGREQWILAQEKDGEWRW
jgi:hypothetical protein